jgi:hypothetical protein
MFPDGHIELTLRFSADPAFVVPLRLLADARHDGLRQRIRQHIADAPEHAAWQAAHRRIQEVEEQRAQLMATGTDAARSLQELLSPEADTPDPQRLAELTQQEQQSRQQADALDRVLLLLRRELADRARALRKVAGDIAEAQRAAALAEADAVGQYSGGMAAAAEGLLADIIPAAIAGAPLRGFLFADMVAENVTRDLTGGPVPPPMPTPPAPLAPAMPIVGIVPMPEPEQPGTRPSPPAVARVG